MSEKTRLRCPDCGAAMNHHADKLDQSPTGGARDPDLDGVLVEFHTCPACGFVLERPADRAPGR